MGVIVEVALLLVLGVIVVTVVRTVASPISEAYAEKVKYKYKELGSETETVLKERVSFLENEVRELKQQVADVQSSLDSVLKHSNTTPVEDHVIKIPEKQAE